MTDPTPTPDDFTVRPSTTDFGPDHTQSSTKDTVRDHLNKEGRFPPKTNQKNPPKPTKSAFSSLGQNKKARSGIRKLTEKDRDQIATFYTFGAAGVMPFRPRVAQVMAKSADQCADAWMELAEENDGVRRAILMIIEGGVWGKVVAAHTPILLALLPENVLPPMFQGIDLTAMNDGDDE